MQVSSGKSLGKHVRLLTWTNTNKNKKTKQSECIEEQTRESKLKNYS